MIESMTGFGRFESSEPDYRLSVEIKSVNHRYLDLNIKMPRRFYAFESAIRAQVRERVQRGKVDLYISHEDYSETRFRLKYNSLLARDYVEHFGEMEESFGLANDLTVSRLAALPEVFVMEEEEKDTESFWPVLSRAIDEALTAFCGARKTEGEQLKQDLLLKLDGLEELCRQAALRAPEVVSEYRARLFEKMREVLDGAVPDEARILTEAAIFADKVCVDEELVRLRTHISHMREVLENGNGVGRKLDFLAQEMNREANTTLSKSNDVALSDIAIGMKTEIEKIREQVQNIE